jgi:hypothetical protein
MAHAALARTKINTELTQAACSQGSRDPAGPRKPGRPPRGPRVSGDARESVRSTDRPVIELGFGILVYPPEAGGELWRAVFTENGQRRFLQGATEAKLAAKLEKVTERLSAGAGNMERPGADLIASYLDPGRLPVLVDNAATAVDLVFHAERWYSLISPASLGRSWIWSVRAGKGSTSGSSSGARSIMPWPWLRPLL